MLPDTQKEMEDMKSHKDKIDKINALLDKLDERLAGGEISEARYKEISDRYKAEAEKLKDHLAEQELMNEVGLEAGEDKKPEYREEQPVIEAVPQRNTKYCSNCRAVIDEMAEICPRCGVRVMTPQVQQQTNTIPITINNTATVMNPQVYQQTKNGALAAILSAIIPGVGQIYCGRGGRGIWILSLSLSLWFLFGSAVSENPDSGGFFILLIILFWIWNIFDASKLARTTHSQVIH